MRRTSVKQKLLKGTLRADRVRNEAQFTIGATCPAYLSKEAKREWRRVAPELTDQGILTEVSSNLLASYCAVYALWREALQDIATKGQVLMVESTTRTGRTAVPKQNPAVRSLLQLQTAMLSSAKLFGLDPLSSQNVTANPIPQDTGKPDPLASLLGDPSAQFEGKH
jgi:P27 family predicted phage terminase small subunit